MEQDVMKKTKEILDKRKKERAHMAAYIYSIYQPYIKTIKGLKSQKVKGNVKGEVSKKLPWNTSLIQKGNIGNENIPIKPSWSNSLLQNQNDVMELQQKELDAKIFRLNGKEKIQNDNIFQIQKHTLPDVMVNFQEFNSHYPM
jgi:hypothetical protein